MGQTVADKIMTALHVDKAEGDLYGASFRFSGKKSRDLDGSNQNLPSIQTPRLT